MKMEESVSKRRNIKFRRRIITQKKSYNKNKDHCSLKNFTFFFKKEKYLMKGNEP
jgi:hypothetical protein